MKSKTKSKGKIVAKNVITREKGNLYFIDKDGNVRSSKMNRDGAKKGHRTCK